MKDNFIRWNEKMFLKYNNARLYTHPNLFVRFIENERVRIILRETASAHRLLDVGCGEGYILSKVRSPEAVGLDISKTAIRRAIQTTKATLVLGDAESMPFTDSYFDAAVCSETLEHTIQPRKVLEEICRVVRPGGTIILTVPNEPLINKIKDILWCAGLFDLLLPDVPRRQDEEWHIHSFDLKTLMELSKDLVLIRKIHSVPTGLLPIRYVAVCKNSKEGPRTSGKLFSRYVRRAKGYFDSLRS